jgi:hypothetical protein
MSAVPLTIDASSLDASQTTRIALAGGLDLAATSVNVDGGLNIDVEGSFSTNGVINAASAVNIDAASGITMGEAAEIVTSNDAINLQAASGDILLGLLNAGDADVSVTASGGDILNNNGVFQNVRNALTNVLGDNVTLSALDRIGVSSSDALTLDIDEGGTISLDFGADTAFINNLQSTRIEVIGGGEVAVGLIFSNQVLGIGHNVGLGGNENSQNFMIVMSEMAELERVGLTILGMDYLSLLASDDEDDAVISSIISTVPVMIKTLDGWRFESPSRQQKVDQLNNGKKEGFKYIDWF